jgi:hypothetical protein
LKELGFDLIHLSINEISMQEAQVPTILEMSLTPKDYKYISNNNDRDFYLQNSNSRNAEIVVFEN